MTMHSDDHPDVSCTDDLSRCTDDFVGRRCQEKRTDIVTDDDINVGESMYKACDWLVYATPLLTAMPPLTDRMRSEVTLSAHMSTEHSVPLLNLKQTFLNC